MNDTRSYLLVLGEREAVGWVLRESRMAFPPTRRAEVDRLTTGDELLIFTTRGCWHNPRRDRGRIVGSARVASPVVAYDEPVTIAGRDFTRGCDLTLRSLTPLGQGVELAPLIPQMGAFPNKKAWSIWLRRPLLELPPGDATLLQHKLKPIACAVQVTAQDYIRQAEVAKH